MARPGLMKHRKFARLARLIGNVPLARGCLELVWEVAYENGDDDVGDAGDLEFAAGWQGEPGKLASALAEAGFLEIDGDRYRVHDLWDHAPEYVAGRRKRESERQRPKVCEECGAEFRSTEEHAKYCSKYCRQAAFRRKHDGKSDAGATHKRRTATEPSVASDAQATQERRTATDGDEPPAHAPAHAHAPAPLLDTTTLSADADREPVEPQAPKSDPPADRPQLALLPTEPKAPTSAERVFDHWRTVMGKRSSTVFDAKRRRAVEGRLRDGYTVEQLCLAVDGCSKTPHNMGQNDQHQRYDDLELICRDASRVDRFIGNASATPAANERDPSMPIPLKPGEDPYAAELEESERIAGAHNA